MVVVGCGVSIERRESSARLREQWKDQRLERGEQSFNGDFRGRGIDGREMETWRAVCSREGEGENRDGKGSHLGFHRGLRCDGGLARLLQWVGHPVLDVQVWSKIADPTAPTILHGDHTASPQRRRDLWNRDHPKVAST